MLKTRSALPTARFAEGVAWPLLDDVIVVCPGVMYPNPPVALPCAVRDCVCCELLELGSLSKLRLSTLKNSARIWNFTFS